MNKEDWQELHAMVREGATDAELNDYIAGNVPFEDMDRALQIANISEREHMLWVYLNLK